MLDKLSFKKTFGALEKAIGLTQRRHTLIASNISNLETPGYKAKDIDFQTALKDALQPDRGPSLTKTHPGHIDMGRGAAPSVEPFEEKGEWNGYNWVDTDREIKKLIENNLMYRVATESLLRKITILKEVIKG